MERGDIYIVPLDPTQGSEQQGTRPVLVVSPGPFMRVSHDVGRRFQRMTGTYFA
jgi:mRNA-degrading endonuclease toxin of MazEF toxin-antitoxin module